MLSIDVGPQVVTREANSGLLKFSYSTQRLFRQLRRGPDIPLPTDWRGVNYTDWLGKPRDGRRTFVKSDGRTHSWPVTLKWQPAARALGVY